MKPQTYIYIESSNEVREKGYYEPNSTLESQILNEYPCSEDCRGRFKDGQEVVEGKDFAIRPDLMTLDILTAYPLTHK